MISVLALNPGFSATEVSEFIGVNKAVVSRSVNMLVGRGLIVLMDGPRGSRPMYLTTEGVQMHDDMLPISMRGQDIVLAHLTPDEITSLNTLLQRMLVDARELQILENETAASQAR